MMDHGKQGLTRVWTRMMKTVATGTVVLGLLASCFPAAIHAAPQAPAPASANKPADATPPAPSAAIPAPAAGSESLLLTMKDLGDADGYTLRTVKTERRYDFTRPTGWKVMPTTHIKVVFQHSPALLPERSSLNILVNNRILRTIPLSKGNVTTTTAVVPIPPTLLKDRNTLTFQVDQHYTYKCEDPYSTELWTEILRESQLRLDYVPQPVVPNLAHFPYPLYDPLGYGTTQVTYAAPASSLSDDSLSALGVVAAGLAQQVSWHPMKTTVTDASGIRRNENVVVIGTPSENPAIGQLASSFKVALSGGKFTDKSTGAVLPENNGVLQYIRNPYHPDKAILVVSGNSPAGVLAAARLLMQNPPKNLLVGQSAIIEEQHAGPAYPYRAWDGFLQVSGATFAQLGLETLTARGVTSLPLYYSVKRMPDLFFPGQTKVGIKTIYSYSSQLDATQSKLEVLLNGKAIKSVPLNDLKGQNLAEMTLNIPSEEFHTFNDLEYKFHLYPEKYDLCNFVTDVHIWGTVHNSSIIEVPGEVKAALPDLGLLNDAGFPFTGYQDLTQVAAVLPEKPQTSDLQLMVQILTRLGRESHSKGGINLLAVHANSPNIEAIKKENHLIVIGDDAKNSLFNQFKSKISLIVSGKTAQLEGEDKPLATISHSPDQGILEEILSPWNDKRVAMLAYGKTGTAVQRLGQLFEDDKLFGKIPASVNVVVMNGDGPKGLQAVKKGEARFFFSADLKNEPQIPTWAWIVIGIFTLIGLVSTVRFLFGR
jgi:hypothetical protein